VDHTKACVVLVSEAGMAMKFVYLCSGSRGNLTILHMSNKKSLNRLIRVYLFKSKYPVKRHGQFAVEFVHAKLPNVSSFCSRH
jgi:hypothetical protein